jgi:hypothetical protein
MLRPMKIFLLVDQSALRKGLISETDAKETVLTMVTKAKDAAKAFMQAPEMLGTLQAKPFGSSLGEKPKTLDLIT